MGGGWKFVARSTIVLNRLFASSRGRLVFALAQRGFSDMRVDAFLEGSGHRSLVVKVGKAKLAAGGRGLGRGGILEALLERLS